MERTRDIRILVTCFAPLRGKKESASKEALSCLRKKERGVELYRAELPHAHGSALARAWEEAEGVHPDGVLLLAAAPGRAVVSVERVAVNLVRGSRPDCREKRIRRDAPDAYFATIPVQQVAAEIVEAGIPAEVSLSAGTGVENELLFGTLDRAKRAGTGMRVGMLQFPCLPEEAVTECGTIPSMGKTVSGAAAERAVRAMARAIRKGDTDD
jgi:pyroglutamyl-peptidase